jgi:hypothetical protein
MPFAAGGKAKLGQSAGQAFGGDRGDAQQHGPVDRRPGIGAAHRGLLGTLDDVQRAAGVAGQHPAVGQAHKRALGRCGKAAGKLVAIGEAALHDGDMAAGRRAGQGLGKDSRLLGGQIRHGGYGDRRRHFRGERTERILGKGRRGAMATGQENEPGKEQKDDRRPGRLRHAHRTIRSRGCFDSGSGAPSPTM